MSSLRKLLPPQEQKLIDDVNSFYTAQEKSLKAYFLAKILKPKLEALITNLIGVNDSLSRLKKEEEKIEKKVEIPKELLSKKSAETLQKQKILADFYAIIEEHKEFFQNYLKIPKDPPSSVRAYEQRANDIYNEMQEKLNAQQREFFNEQKICHSSLALEHHLQIQANWRQEHKEHLPDIYYIDLIKKNMEVEVKRLGKDAAIDRRALTTSEAKVGYNEARDRYAAAKKKYPTWQKRVFNSEFKSAKKAFKDAAKVTKAQRDIFNKCESNLLFMQAKEHESTVNAILDSMPLSSTSKINLVPGTIYHPPKETTTSATALSSSHDRSTASPPPSASSFPDSKAAPITVTFHRKPKKTEKTASNDDNEKKKLENKNPSSTP